jgi:hypothetical protein
MAGASGVYTGGGATVVMDPPPVVYVKVFHPGSGPDRNAKARAQRVAIIAQRTAPTKTGFMASQIYADQNREENGQYSFGYKVVSPVYYSYYVHEGTDPSLRQTYPDVMKFPGLDGWPTYTDVVHHPGNSAQPWLQDALVGMAD